MKRINIFAAVLFTAITLSAQELKTYSGSFKGGQATYTYYETDDGRVYDGKFHWKSNLGDGEMTGTFKNNKRDGLWIYTYRESTFKVNYVNGIPNGKFEIKGNFWGLEECTLSATMINGRANGPVKIEESNSVITGEYNQNKRIGVWERRFLNGSYYHVLCKGSKAPYYNNYINEDSYLANEVRDGNFFYDMEDGKKYKTTEEKMLSTKGGGQIEVIIFTVCINLETLINDFGDFGIVIPEVSEEEKKSDDNDYIYSSLSIPEYDQAQFPGGDEECIKWLNEHMKYPDVCKENKVQGCVFVDFVVNKDGSIVNVEVDESPDLNLSKEAERLIKMMPKWKPAKRNNKMVRSRVSIPVDFRLNESTSMSQSNTQGTSQRALSPEEVKILYEREKAKNEAEQLRVNLERFGFRKKKK